MTEPGFIAAVLKWVDLRPDVDPLEGTVRHDDRTSGFSLADAAALECALLLGEAWQLPVAAITAGPPGAQAVLRDAAAFGPRRLVLVTADIDAPSEAIAEALAPLLDGAAVVCCGDYSADRGSGSVPAFLAHQLEAAQAHRTDAPDTGLPDRPAPTRRRPPRAPAGNRSCGDLRRAGRRPAAPRIAVRPAGRP